MPKPKSGLLDGHVKGYPKLARQMGVFPESAIFRSFGALNAKNLLYLQAELTYLEEALRDMEVKDNASAQGEKARYSSDWFWLEVSAQERDGDASQLSLILKIREKLREYNETLYYQAVIYKLEPPDYFDLKDVQGFIRSPEMELPLVGPDRNIWGKYNDPTAHADDGLIALCPRQRTDAFSSKLSEHAVYVMHFFKRIFGKVKKGSVTYGYRDTTVSTITFWVTSMVASAMPVISIIALVYIPTLKVRLAAIAGFNALMSLCLLMFTEARRIDVFSITAA
ncbi:uncharacterized protein J4E87_001594 [Alternaria ethzedia]|uniref:uncharacterized protein n=1 Tax=Alternaria ethzedia TaxID=181014 RepID=UPI0020C2CD67|nr:uncharacterized protein J4E87_001594 [Alternaria ethzedia]KAI4632123.1 hypothetical protein J4E87_001594 [Alternaria ethzedia]